MSTVAEFRDSLRVIKRRLSLKDRMQSVSCVGGTSGAANLISRL